MERPHLEKFGSSERYTFGTVENVMDMPNLIKVQKDSYDWFINEGIREAFESFSPITDYAEKLSLEFGECTIQMDKAKYSIEECKIRDATYAAPMRVKVRVVNNETGAFTESSDVFMGDFPIMTNTGTFIINGAERVIVSQLVRSPSVYYDKSIDKKGNTLYSAQVIPNRGAWLEYETDSTGVLWVHIDRTRKVPITCLLRALGYSSDEQIYQEFGEHPRLKATVDKDTSTNKEEGVLTIFKNLRPGEAQSAETAIKTLRDMFFDPRRYDLARVGRYKFNIKLSIAARIKNHIAAENIVDPETGELFVAEGEVIDAETAENIRTAGINRVVIRLEDDVEAVIIGNHFVDAKRILPFDPAECGLLEDVYYPMLHEIIKDYDLDDESCYETLKNELREHKNGLMPFCVVEEDIFATISYLIYLERGIGYIDDIDHLGNRRLRCVGEQLQNQFRVGLTRMERGIRERMSVTDTTGDPSAQSLVNIRPLVAAIKEFFGSNQLSQFMDQHNPLSELTHKRRTSALGPGGLNRDRAGFEVRDIHDSHYGRLCPVETPEGPNIGLIGSLATYSSINEYGFLESSYRRVDQENKRVTDEVVYMTADEEEHYIIAQAKEPLDENNYFVNKKIACRAHYNITEEPRERIQFMDVSAQQIVSVATALIPFVENDDAARALMGSNMQRQAVPLIKTEAPAVGTGMEYRAALDSGAMVVAEEDGTVVRVSADEVIVQSEEGREHRYHLIKFMRSNQGTCINQRPIVARGQHVAKGEVLADGTSTDHGELALGRNVLMAFMNWEGYNYEDAVLLSEELVRDDVYTSIHIEKYECEARDTKLGPEEITREIANVGQDALKNLDERGIIRLGAEVHSGDILVGKVTPKGETELTSEERLLRAIFGDKAREVRDTSLKVPHGEGGIIVDVKIFTREQKDELAPGVKTLVRISIAQKRKISVGDKMAGRHGNKGVVSRVLPVEDMPFLPDGRPLQIVLNPLGVPSRMNIGQVLEVHLGRAAIEGLKGKVATPVFDGAKLEDIKNLYEKYNLNEPGRPFDGKLHLRDGRTGEYFDNPVTVGYMHMMKLLHLVDDKMHARSTGPYSLVTQQPLGGKAQFGGQRFGEMEVWALEAYGAAYTLQEILTVKSDDTVGRVNTYDAIVHGSNLPVPGIPESFKVLIKEMQSLSLDIAIMNDGKEIELVEEDDLPNAYVDSHSAKQEAMRKKAELESVAAMAEAGISASDVSEDNDVVEVEEKPVARKREVLPTNVNIGRPDDALEGVDDAVDEFDGDDDDFDIPGLEDDLFDFENDSDDSLMNGFDSYGDEPL